VKEIADDTCSILRTVNNRELDQLVMVVVYIYLGTGKEEIGAEELIVV